MTNAGLFSSLYIESLKKNLLMDDAARGRMAAMAHTWKNRDAGSRESLWETFLKQASGYLEFVPPREPTSPGVYPLYEGWDYASCVTVLYVLPPGVSLDGEGAYCSAKLLAELSARGPAWGILTDGERFRLYCAGSQRPFEDHVELSLTETLAGPDEGEYLLFERFFHASAFLKAGKDEGTRLDEDRRDPEKILEEMVKKPLLAQIDEVLQYICNGFIFDTKKTGEDYTEEERAEIFGSAVKLIYRCLFLFYAESRRLLPSDPAKSEEYTRHSARALCLEARRFRWGGRTDTEGWDLWQGLQGLVRAVNDGDPEYGIMGYNGGLFDDAEERFLGRHRLRNDFLARALYLLAYVEPLGQDRDGERPIPYEDLEVRHLGELYENILEYTVLLADADRVRRRGKKGVEILLASAAGGRRPGDALIKKGEVYFGESALERKQTGSYYTPEPLVRFLVEQSVVQPLREAFDAKHRERFDEFLAHARHGADPGARRGAAEAAAALVLRFVEEDVLSFSVCDPAMGSGHFLVGAVNAAAGLVMSLLGEIPFAGGLPESLPRSPNHWRRLVTRHCVYGVDLNPLAVDLAKLSLWLNSFAGEHKLTFLDHRLKCGNSLVGLRELSRLKSIPRRRKDGKTDSGTTLFPLDDLSEAFSRAAGRAAAIARIDEDDTDRQKSALSEAEGLVSPLRPLADLYTAYLMDPAVRREDYRRLFEILAAGGDPGADFDQALPRIAAAASSLRERHRYFHWPLEFPEVFGPEGAGGFSACVGNPPWDMSSANPQDFFESYDAVFRSLNRTESLKQICVLCENPRIREKWAAYQEGYQQKNLYYNNPTEYPHAPSGRNNLFQYFLHRTFDLLKTEGRIGLIIPSGIYTDQGCLPLRKLFFEKSRIDFLYCFENRWPTVFSAVDGRFKFVAFGARKGGKTGAFKCAFMEHDPERLQAIDEKALVMTVEQVRKFSPDTLSVMEFKNQRDIDVSIGIYADHPLMGDKLEKAWNIRFSIEFMSNTDAWRFSKYEPSLIPVYAGRNFLQFDSEYLKPEQGVEVKHLVETYLNKIDYWKQYRLVFRDIARNTDERTCISSIISPPNAFVETARLIYADDLPNVYTAKYNERNLCYITAVLNSLSCDFIMRQMVNAHLSQHIMSRIPLIRLMSNDSMHFNISSRTLRLICETKNFADLWVSQWNNRLQSPDFWYPPSAPINDYGPLHEREIRARLRDEAPALTAEWGPHCGAHDRLPDRRDTGDRAQLRAEIDAYVAHLYGLSRDDFAYILDTFPVLKKKETKAFGEFQSKRKCLEEYDRIGKVMRG